LPLLARQVLAGLGGGAFGLFLVVAFIASLHAVAQSVAPAPSPSVVAMASATPTASPTPTDSPTPTLEPTPSPTPTDTPVPTASPSPTPSPSPGVTAPEHPLVLTRVSCLFLGPAASIGGRLYAACAGNQVLAIDLATGKVARTYQLTRSSSSVLRSPTLLEVKDALWVQWNDALIQRYDLSSGKLTGQVPGNRIVADSSGGIWIETQDGAVHSMTARSAMPPAPSGGGGIPSTYIGCGSIWQVRDGSLYVSSLATGASQGTFPVASGTSVARIGPACWLVKGSARAGYELTNLSTQCAGSRTMSFSGLPFDLGGTTWMLKGGGMVQLSLATGRTYGSIWQLPGGLSLDQNPVYAGGQVWTGSSTELVRLDIPLKPISGQGSMTPVVCPSPSPTPTPSPTPSPTPTASPTPTPAASPTPTPTPSPTPTGATPTPKPTPTPTATPTATPTPA
jgi:outer membrane protein assembly factor BamB